MTSKLKTDVLETGSGSGTIALNNQLSGMTSASMPSGSVLQVVSVTKSDTFSVSGTTFTDVTGLAATITPTSTSSKIMVQVTMNLDGSERYGGAKLLRGSTQIGMGDASGSRTRMLIQADTNQDANYDTNLMHNGSASIQDSPATTSATTYKVQIGHPNASGAVTYCNRSHGNSDGASTAVGMSTITLTEIKG